MNATLNHALIHLVQMHYEHTPLAVFLMGPNGSGKSTLRHYLNLSDIQMNIDPDALNRIFKQKHPHHHLIEATKHALGMYTDGLQNNLNLCLETTLAGHGATQRIQKAATARYFLIGYFVGLNDVHLNLQRIRARVARGGHDIPEPLVRKRYTESSTQLIKVRHYFNELHVIDNSQDAFSLQWSQYGHRVIHHTNSLENWASMLLNATP